MYGYLIKIADEIIRPFNIWMIFVSVYISVSDHTDVEKYLNNTEYHYFY